MQKKFSVAEIQAVAEAAITARNTANAAKKAFDDAGGTDEALKTAWEGAEQKAVAAESAAEALSQGPEPLSPEKIAKMKRKREIISRELRDAGVSDDEDEEDEDDDDEDDTGIDLDKPITGRDLQRIERSKAKQSAREMADAITDAPARDAVRAALKRIVASGDPAKDFTDAVAIANREKHSKILEEIQRRGPSVRHQSGAGAPPRKEDDAFEPTADEARYMRHPFNLTKEQILAARPK